MKWSKIGLSLALGLISGVSTGILDEKRSGNRHTSNTLSDKLKAFDRKIYLDGKKRADQLEEIKKTYNDK